MGHILVILMVRGEMEERGWKRSWSWHWQKLRPMQRHQSLHHSMLSWLTLTQQRIASCGCKCRHEGACMPHTYVL